MGIRDWFRHRLVKSARGFSPGKKLTGGITVYQASMTLLSMELILYARTAGPIDEARLRVLERVHGHFNEHVMFTKSPQSIQIGVFSDMDSDFDERGRHFFLQAWESAARDLGQQLPAIVNKELVAHLALFLRVDTIEWTEAERRASIRDSHALLLGAVTPNDVDDILHGAASYVLENSATRS